MKLLLPLLISLFLLSFSISLTYAIEKVDTIYFTVQVPDTWSYELASKSPTASLTGYGPTNLISLAPDEFGDFLIVDDYEKLIDGMQTAGGAIAEFSQDSNYAIKNAPLETYVKYRLRVLNVLNTTSREDTIIDGEKAIKITENATLDLPFIHYFVVHDNEPYYFFYAANNKDYNKYLPEFEQLLKSFRFKH